jgi:hypothetical protein
MHDEFKTDDFVNSFVGVWRRVTGDPRGFFREMPLGGGLQGPIVFLLVTLALGALGFLIVGPRGFAFHFLLHGLIRSFVYGVVLMLVARHVFAGSGDFEANYRVVAYAAAPLALVWIPLLGKLAILYSAFLVIVGLERANAFDAVKAVLTVLLAAVALFAVTRIFGFGGSWGPRGRWAGHCPWGPGAGYGR